MREAKYRFARKTCSKELITEMTNRDSHNLRPFFTHTLIKTLQGGTLINLIATIGQGRKRLLEDIKKTQKRHVKILSADIVKYKNNYKELIQILWQQADNKGKSPTELQELILKLKKTGQHIIILLYNFDELLNNAYLDKKFDVHFFNQLNNLKHQSKISLLCVTTQPYDQSMMFIKGKKPCYSGLNLDKKRLPKLTHDEIKLELKCRDLSLSRNELSQITWAVFSHAEPYHLLDFFSYKIKNKEDENVEISQRIKMWINQYQKEHHPITTSHVTAFNQFLNIREMGKGIKKRQTLVMLFLKSLKFFGHLFTQKRVKGYTNKRTT
ncbi:MAG: hypothetical protein DRQ99_27930 [Candidatus Parabeggiatoa sp. nov. 3]|nr:MAG: hypothetical protein DRQ99_27930 [Gammaproteobacteria bacterium]